MSGEVKTSMRVGRFSITHELLKAALKFPPDCLIADVRMTNRVGEFEIRVTGDSMPIVCEGDEIRPLKPRLHVIKTNKCDCEQTLWEWC